MQLITLTQGKVTLVDDNLFEELNQFKWHTKKEKDTCYARRNIIKNGKKTSILMHRVILGLTDRNIHADHINGDGLNNQLTNLRACTHKENLRNQRNQSGCSSIYKGVSFNKERKNWESKIKVDKKTIHLGRFTSEIEAAQKYNIASLKYFGEFSRLNIFSLTTN